MDDGDRLTVFSITELYILKCLQRHIKCYVNFTIKIKKRKKKKKSVPMIVLYNWDQDCNR